MNTALIINISYYPIRIQAASGFMDTFRSSRARRRSLVGFQPVDRCVIERRERTGRQVDQRRAIDVDG